MTAKADAKEGRCARLGPRGDAQDSRDRRSNGCSGVATAASRAAEPAADATATAAATRTGRREPQATARDLPRRPTLARRRERSSRGCSQGGSHRQAGARQAEGLHGSRSCEARRSREERVVGCRNGRRPARVQLHGDAWRVAVATS
jgi:hypothetical protein